MKIYVASSWRNEHQPKVVAALREAGHEVYDFRNPAPGNNGFSWSDIDADWQNWTTEQYREALQHPIAQKGFDSDFDAMKWADVCVLLLPCGRSAHSEAGWMQGKYKPTIVLQFEKAEPELMYKMYECICTSIDEVLKALTELGTKTIECFLCGEQTQKYGNACSCINFELNPDTDEVRRFSQEWKQKASTIPEKY